MSSNRRTPRNILVQPREQLRLVFGVLGAFLFLQSLLLAYTYHSVREYLDAVAGYYNMSPVSAAGLESGISSSLLYIVLASFGVTLLAMLTGLRMSHRIYGPIAAIKRYLQALQEGHYEARLELRRGDEFQELRDELNRLAAQLQARHGSPKG